MFFVRLDLERELQITVILADREMQGPNPFTIVPNPLVSQTEKWAVDIV